MSKKKPTQKAFPPRDDIYARVRAMRRAALRIVDEGLDDGRCEWTQAIPYEEPEVKDGQVDALVTWTAAVYATGIAVGLLFRESAFTKGGKR